MRCGSGLRVNARHNMTRIEIIVITRLITLLLLAWLIGDASLLLPVALLLPTCACCGGGGGGTCGFCSGSTATLTVQLDFTGYAANPPVCTGTSCDYLNSTSYILSQTANCAYCGSGSSGCDSAGSYGYTWGFGTNQVIAYASGGCNPLDAATRWQSTGGGSQDCGSTQNMPYFGGALFCDPSASTASITPL